MGMTDPDYVKKATTYKKARSEADELELNPASLSFRRTEAPGTCSRMPRKEQKRLEYVSPLTQVWQLQNMIQCQGQSLKSRFRMRVSDALECTACVSRDLRRANVIFPLDPPS